MPAMRPCMAAVPFVIIFVAATTNAFVPPPQRTTATTTTTIFPPFLTDGPRSFSSTRLYYIHRRKKYNGPDYYAILDISRLADQKEIKLAYRKMAKIYHPDANPGQKTSEMFQRINRAYEILKDPALKRKYDVELGNYAAQTRTSRNTEAATSTSGVGKGGVWKGDSTVGWTTFNTGRGYSTATSSSGEGGFYSSPGDHFYTSSVDDFSSYSEGTTKKNNNNNGHSRDYFTKRRAWTSGGPVAGDDLRFDLEIDLKTAMFGGDREIRIRHMETCQPCMGKGIKVGSGMGSWRACTLCGGTGSTPEVTQTPLGIFHSQQVCRTCHGTGRERVGGGETASDYCRVCEAQGITSKTKRIKVTIPPNIKSGNKLRIRGEGDAGFNGGPAGDLYIYLTVRQQQPGQQNAAGSEGWTSTNESAKSSWKDNAESWKEFTRNANGSSGSASSSASSAYSNDHTTRTASARNGGANSSTKWDKSSGANFENFYSPNWNDEEFFSVSNGTAEGFYRTGANTVNNGNGNSNSNNGASSHTDAYGRQYTENGHNGSSRNNRATDTNGATTYIDENGNRYTKNGNTYGPASSNGYGRDNGFKNWAASKHGRDTVGVDADTIGGQGSKDKTDVDKSGIGIGFDTGASFSDQNGARYGSGIGTKFGFHHVANGQDKNGVKQPNIGNNNGAKAGDSNIGANIGFKNGGPVNGAKYSPMNGNSVFNSNGVGSSVRYRSGVYSAHGYANNNGASYTSYTDINEASRPNFNNGASVRNRGSDAVWPPNSGKKTVENPFFVNGEKLPNRDPSSAPGAPATFARGPVVGADLSVNVEVDLNKTIVGGEERLTFAHLVTCNSCFGRGAKYGSRMITCSSCGGSGSIAAGSFPIGGSIPSPQVQQPCGHCRGTGQRFTDGCESCSGRGSKPVMREIKVVIPPGCKDGNQLYVQGEGDAGPNAGPPGDLYINLKVKNNP